MATLGLLLFAAPLEKELEDHLERRFSETITHKLTGPISEYFLFTLAAQLMTLPVIALQFKRISLSALIANPLVLPVQPAILICGGISTGVGMVFPAAGKMLAVLTWPFLAYSNFVVQSLAHWDWGSMTLSSSNAIGLSVVLLLIVLLVLLRKYVMKNIKNFNWVYLAMSLLVAASLIWTMVFRQPDGNMHLSLIRAGDGSALFLRSPQGSTLLIDPAGSANELTSQVDHVISPWNFHVDAAMFTNREAVKSFTELNNHLPIRQALLLLPVYQQSNSESAVTLPEGILIKKLVENEGVQVEENLAIQPLASDNIHTALLVTYGNTRILIPGGVKPELLKTQRIASLESLSVLILGEDDTANLPADMWQHFNPQVILWNSPAVSPHPDWRGLDSYSMITISGDGTGYSIENQR